MCVSECECVVVVSCDVWYSSCCVFVCVTCFSLHLPFTPPFHPQGGVLCINPGKLTRNTAGGHYALLSVHPRGQVDGAKTTDIGVRTAVEIIKI